MALASAQTKSAALEEIKNAYQNSVMAVPHYEEEYGEPLEENMAIEFGKDVADSVSNGTELTPMLQQVLVSKANKAAKDRKFPMQTISREWESLREAEEAFTEIQEALSKFHPDKLKAADYSTLSDRWEELDELECRCSETTAVRQEHIRKEPLDGTAPGDGPSLFEYLYQTLEVDYPVLATGARTNSNLETNTRECSVFPALTPPLFSAIYQRHFENIDLDLTGFSPIRIREFAIGFHPESLIRGLRGPGGYVRLGR